MKKYKLSRVIKKATAHKPITPKAIEVDRPAKPLRFADRFMKGGRFATMNIVEEEIAVFEEVLKRRAK